MGFSAVFRPSFLLGCSWYLIHDRLPIFFISESRRVHCQVR